MTATTTRTAYRSNGGGYKLHTDERCAMNGKTRPSAVQLTDEQIANDRWGACLRCGLDFVEAPEATR